jgi:hypothetical protein
MDTILFLKSIVHFDSYTHYILWHMGKVAAMKDNSFVIVC